MRVLVCGIAVLAIAASVNAAMLMDGGFEDAGSAWTIQNVASGNAASMGSLVSGWKFDIDKNGSGTLGGTLNPASTAQASNGLQSLEVKYTGVAASAAVYQILPAFGNNLTVNWTYAVKPVTLQTGSFWIEIGYYKNLAVGTTTIDPNNLSGAVLIKKWDAWGLGVPTVGSWNTASGSFTMSGNTSGVAAYFVKVGGNATNDVFFDNLTFTPEPAAVALLGLPMLLMARRRR